VIDEHRQLLDTLTAEGCLTDAWRPAFEQVPRHLFVPDAAWLTDDDRTRIDRVADPAGWLACAYADQPIITQWDDGDSAGRMRSPTSSLSMPTIVALMLDTLDICPGHRVLEIGTGSGWNAALLSARVDPDHVTSIEVDPGVAAAARAALDAAGVVPDLVVGDGADGHPPNAPYDRILATCSVTSIPPAWIAQTRPGGIIVTPWRIPLLNGLLLRLVVGDDGTATGTFVHTAMFMPLRSQRVPDTDVGTDTTTDPDTTTLDPRQPLNDDHAQFVVGLLVGDCYTWTEPIPGGYAQRIDDPDSDSWAVVHVIDGTDDRYPVWQGGPRRLWDEITAAYQWWLDADSPVFSRFGIHIDGGVQRVFLDRPDAAPPVPGFR
jgi:protein-L-isoaspartate(D-aspartate) O-methyltransferase